MAKFYCFLILFFTINQVHAKIHFKEVKFEKINPKLGQLEILFDNDVIEIPWLKFEEKAIHLVVPKSKIKSQISKRIQLEKNIGINFVGETLSNDDSRMSVLLPYSISKLKTKVNVNLKDRRIFLNFPLAKVKNAKIKKIAEKNDYDEKYLQKLINEKESKDMAEKEKNIESDIVKTTFSSLPKEKESFSLAEQALKFFHVSCPCYCYFLWDSFVFKKECSG